MSESFNVSRVMGLLPAAAVMLLSSAPAIATGSNLGPSDKMLAQAHRILSPDHSAAVSDEPEGGGPVTLRVGSTCTYATIQAAIDAAPGDVAGAIIRIRQGSYSENLFIGTKNIEIIGGHSNCETTTPTNRSTISGVGGTASAITFFPGSSGGITSRSLILRRLSLVGGTGTALAPGGGLSVVSNSGTETHVTITDVDIGLNNGLRGGGISLVQTGTEGGGSLGMQNVLVNANTVTGDNPFGGGLYCNGEFQVLKIGGEIGSNVAGTTGNTNARGGGVYLDGCDMAWYAHNESVGTGRLRNNTVHGGGGGIYAMGGSEVLLIGALLNLFGDPVSTRPLIIETNEALAAGTNGRGGGIWANNATVNLQATWLQENNSENGNGGAIAATDGAIVNLNRAVGNTNCHTSVECSRIINNRAGDTGGAVYVQHAGSEINMDATVIRNNASLSGAGATLFASQDGRIRVVNSLITRGSGAVGLPDSPSNQPNYTFWLSAGSRIDILYSTIADSEPNTAVFRFGSTNSDLFLRGSILHEQSGVNPAFLTSETPYVDTDCSMWHSNQLTTLGGGGIHTRNRLADPLFINRTTGNFMLGHESQARDYCNSDTAGFGPPPATDLRTRTRGVFSGQTALHGLYDIGAFEMLPDGLFSDRFEQSLF
jgi:hypothetical protein